MIYFDNAATTPLHPEVKEAMISAMDVFGNPASIHQLGRKSRVWLENQRTNVSALLGVQPGEIVFTSGGTESLQTVLASAVMDHGIGRIITSPLEHPAVLKNLAHLKGIIPLEVVHAGFDNAGRIDLAHLESLMHTDQKTLVVLMHANNETGMLLPMKKVASLCSERQVPFLSDTVQTMGKYAGNPAEGAFFAAASAHKFHGPKGVGLLYMNGDMPVQPLIRGGGQERNLRSGTENLTAIVGLAKALEVALRDLEKVKSHIESLRNAFVDSLKEIVPEAEILTDLGHSLYTILNVAFPVHRTGEMLVYRFDMEGVAVSGGSACASGVNHPSHVLEALGCGDGFEHVRFSFSRFNTAAEVERCLEIITKMLK